MQYFSRVIWDYHFIPFSLSLLFLFFAFCFLIFVPFHTHFTPYYFLVTYPSLTSTISSALTPTLLPSLPYSLSFYLSYFFPSLLHFLHHSLLLTLILTPTHFSLLTHNTQNRYSPHTHIHTHIHTLSPPLTPIYNTLNRYSQRGMACWRTEGKE